MMLITRVYLIVGIGCLDLDTCNDDVNKPDLCHSWFKMS